MKWFLVFYLFTGAVRINVPFETKEACFEAGEKVYSLITFDHEPREFAAPAYGCQLEKVQP